MVLILLGLFLQTGWAQRGGRLAGRGQSEFQDTVPQGEVLVDTFPIYYFSWPTFYRESAFSDSLLDVSLRQHEPTRKRKHEYRHLGVNGSAATPLLFRPHQQRGLDVGFHQYDAYKLPLDSIRHYRLEKAFTQVAYYTGGEQANGYFTAKFSRDFANGLNFSLDYRRLAYLGTRTLYPNQNARNTSLGLGFWIRGQNDRYQSFIHIVSNRFDQDDNGGIAEEPREGEGFNTPGSAEVFLTESGTRHNLTDLQFAQLFRLGKIPGLSSRSSPPPARRGRERSPSDTARTDSLLTVAPSPSPALDSITNQQFWLSHTLSWSDHTYRFFDRDPSQDSIYYGPFLTDVRGLRQFVGHRRLRNHFRVLTFRASEGSGPRASRGLLSVGIEHQAHWLDLEATDSTVQNLFLTGQWDVQLGEVLRLETRGHLGLLDQAGDYRAEGILSIDIREDIRLRGHLINQLYTPAVITDRFWVSERQLWDNEFSKTLETNLSVSLSIPRWRMQITGGYHLLNNYVFYDVDGTVRQISTPISIGQLIVEKDFALGKFRLDNMLVFQVASEDVVPLPGIHGKHALYFDGQLFQVLNTQMGFDLRYNTSYLSTTYFPVTGQFILQNQQEVSFYPSVDAFFSLRVTKFRAFVRWFNLTETLLPDRLYYQTALYPYPPGANLRIGINWRFTE